MNITEVIRKAGRRFGDTNNVLIEEQDFLDWINEAQLEICRETGILTTSTSVAANLFPWALPSTLIEVTRVLYNSTPINKIEVETIDDLGINVSNYSDGPLYFYILNGSMYLFPPANASDTTSISIQYANTPTTIASTATALAVPVMYHEDIVKFLVMRCHEMNQNYRAQEIAYNEFKANIGLRLDEKSIRDDSYPTIRDDPWDMMQSDASIW